MPTASNGLVEIKSGLDISSRIIATGFEKLADGDRIRIVGEISEIVATPHKGGTESSTLPRLPQGESH
jgi:hypothetical protein